MSDKKKQKGKSAVAVPQVVRRVGGKEVAKAKIDPNTGQPVDSLDVKPDSHVVDGEAQTVNLILSMNH